MILGKKNLNEENLVVSENLIKITKSDPILINKNIYNSNKNEDESIYINAINRNPMYCPNGTSFIDELIQNIKSKKSGWKDKLIDHQELIKKMLSHGLLEYQETNDIKKNYNIGNNNQNSIEAKKEIRKKSGLSLYLLLSQSCNLGCIYCLDGEETYCKSSNLNMDENTAINAIRHYAKELNPQGRMEIVFFGGEPLLNWDLAKRIMEIVTTIIKNEFHLINFHFHLTSNLYKLPADLVEYAHKYNMTFLCEVVGPPEIHDKVRPNRAGNPSCEQIVKNIKYLISHGIKINLRATITSHNHDKLLEISRFHKEIGGIGTAYVLVNPINSDEMVMPKEWLPDVDQYLSGLQQILADGIWNIDQIFPLNEHKKRIGNSGKSNCNCGAPYGNTPTVDVNGSVYPCVYWVGMPRFLLGNIADEKKLNNNPLCDELVEKLNVDNRSDCKNCKWKYLCGGGCAVNFIPAIYRFGIMDKVDPAIIEYMLKFTCKLTAGCLSICHWEIINKDLKDYINITL